MHAVFEAIVDYAGLFPPASLTMREAVSAYHGYRNSPDRWMLGRFVAAASRLTEFGEAVERLGAGATDRADPWQLSVVTSAELPADLALIEAFRQRWGERGIQVDAIEHRVSSREQIGKVGELVPDDLIPFLEFPSTGPFPELAAGAAEIGAHAKIRTGGTTPELFPAAAELSQFLSAVTARGVRFKATAGLHHPLRGAFPLTYDQGAESHTMYGFVNVLLATAELLRSGEASTAQQILEEEDPSAITEQDDAIVWRATRYPFDELARVRERAFVGFGSCSFREPVDELQWMVVQ
ncbi:MAG: hypothetical protein V4503_12610 [Gemmatimonadota bacterium]